jgi:hypothetical protein
MNHIFNVALDDQISSLNATPTGMLVLHKKEKKRNDHPEIIKGIYTNETPKPKPLRA